MQQNVLAPPFRRLRVALCALVVGTGCAGFERPTPPPKDQIYALPWGAVPTDVADRERRRQLEESIENSFRDRLVSFRETHAGQPWPYRVLSLSGGGSRGAYGAGVLTGWTERGDRPEFDTVTGISTGALLATTAFLGSSYDEDLRVYTEVGNEEIFTRRGLWGTLRGDASNDTAPLKQLLERTITPAILDAVAEEHRRGRRLFVGTTNLDAQTFTIWDMGHIARSKRPDRGERYREVLLASASFPMVFPPVYIAVERDGETYHQLHVDGGARETVFFYDFVDEYRDAADDLGLTPDDFHAELYLLNNGPLHAEATYRPVEGGILSVAGATIESLMRKVTISSLYRLWVLALSSGADFHLTYIPRDFDLSPNSLAFDQTEMEALFELGRSRVLAREAWSTQRAPETLEELAELIDPRESIDRLEARPWSASAAD